MPAVTQDKRSKELLSGDIMDKRWRLGLMPVRIQDNRPVSWLQAVSWRRCQEADAQLYAVEDVEKLMLFVSSTIDRGADVKLYLG